MLKASLGHVGKTLNPFQANVPFLYALKTSENQRFSNDFRGYRNEPLAWNGLEKAKTHYFDFISIELFKL